MTFVVTAHQPNLLIGANIVSKIEVSDAVIWLDEVQYTKGGWTNRNKLPNGEWLSVPVERHCAFKPINRVRIGDPVKDWRGPLVHKLVDAWPGETTSAVCREILRPYRLLVGLNTSLLKITLESLSIFTPWIFQSHLDGGHAVVAQSREKSELAPISHRLAMMVEELGGTVYLSGPSGRNYLDEAPFKERDITVEYWNHTGPTSCILELCSMRESIAA